MKIRRVKFLKDLQFKATNNRKSTSRKKLRERKRNSDISWWMTKNLSSWRSAQSWRSSVASQKSWKPQQDSRRTLTCRRTSKRRRLTSFFLTLICRWWMVTKLAQKLRNFIRSRTKYFQNPLTRSSQSTCLSLWLWRRTLMMRCLKR